jgi:hypothetical protein
LTPEPPPTVLHHGTTLHRARSIEANGPDPNYREPGTGSLLPAEAFSAVIGDGRACSTGTPEMFARAKDALCGLDELRADWPNLTKRVIPL